jgi:hypothetical protein
VFNRFSLPTPAATREAFRLAGRKTPTRGLRIEPRTSFGLSRVASALPLHFGPSAAAGIDDAEYRPEQPRWRRARSLPARNGQIFQETFIFPSDVADSFFNRAWFSPASSL